MLWLWCCEAADRGGWRCESFLENQCNFDDLVYMYDQYADNTFPNFAFDGSVVSRRYLKVDSHHSRARATSQK